MPDDDHQRLVCAENDFRSCDGPLYEVGLDTLLWLRRSGWARYFNASRRITW